MAEERSQGAQNQKAPEAQDGDNSKAQEKKEKKHSKFMILLWLFFLVIGSGVGLHLSGVWDGRPFLWSIVPKIPWVGEPLSEILQVPEQYTLTVSERRERELTDWQKRLDERERNLTQRAGELDLLSGDIEIRSASLTRREDALAQAALNNQDSDTATPSEQALIDQVARTYQDMSARNAAAIVEQLREKLAVDLLRKLPTDVRSSILGKMKPAKAARLTELMTRN